MKKKVHMIGNAHLDPVWQWRWQEGVTQVKQTIQSALDRLDESDDFVFVSSQAVMYKWLSLCAPGMIPEIKRRIEEGRFVICGGQWVQPDCNTPSGESFVRQSLYAQRLFKELLGVTATTAYNVDSFGHNAMLPQIFKKSGMNAYVMMRPGPHEKTLPANIFIWRAPDGTEIPVYRIHGSYTGNYQNYEDAENDIKATCDSIQDGIDSAMVFYGVGNHGGGPTKKNIALVKEVKENYKNESDIFFSDPNTFFEEIKGKEALMPVVEDDLQHHASGCYSAVSELKRLNRRCEAELYFAEAYASITKKLMGLNYPMNEFRLAWEDVMFNHFHDAMGGCSAEQVFDDAYAFAGEALSIAARQKDISTQAISWAVDTSEMDGTPVVIFNPHPWKVKVPVTINFQAPSIKTLEGETLLSQHVYSPTKSCTWRDDTLFMAELPAMGYATYLIGGEAEKPESAVAAEPAKELQTSNNFDGGYIENEYLKVSFIPYNGYIKSIIDKTTGEELLNGCSAVPVVIDEYSHDAWSHAKNFFDKELARFSDAEISVVESGPLRATVKAVSRYNDSTMTQYFSLIAGERRLRVRAECDWREKYKMLKLAFNTDVGENPRIFYEIPFGYFERPCDGEEENGHRYIVLTGSKRGMALLNDSRYSFSVKDSEMRMTIVRSPVFSDHGGPRTSESVFTDQGLTKFEYELVPVSPEGDFAAVERMAAELNCPPVNIIENNHKGCLAPSGSFVSVDADNVSITAFKRAEDDNGWIVRAYETAGRGAEAKISLPLLDEELNLSFGKFEVKTVFIPDLRADAGDIREVMMTEFDF